MYETLTNGETLNAGTWAMEYNGTEMAGMQPGVVYGIAKCTPQAGTRLYTSATPSSTYDELSAAQKAVWNSVPAKTLAQAIADGETHTDSYSNTTASNATTEYKNCWCKMTGIGVPGDNGTAASGAVYPVSGAAWVFFSTGTSAAVCANRCARGCALRVHGNAGYRAAVFNTQ